MTFALDIQDDSVLLGVLSVSASQRRREWAHAVMLSSDALGQHVYRWGGEMHCIEMEASNQGLEMVLKWEIHIAVFVAQMGGYLSCELAQDY